MNLRTYVTLALTSACLVACERTTSVGSSEAPAPAKKTLSVTASAYTSREGETDSTPNIAAWGDRLDPGVKAIAVSRDLIKQGLSHNTEVKISGLKGTYRVLDKMNKRWSNKIDIYMGNDLSRAKDWGKRAVTISWVPKAKP